MIKKIKKLGKKCLYRLTECVKIREKEIEFDRKLARGMAQDTHYALPDDAPLTAQQKAEIDAFWGKYAFAFKPPYSTFQAYMNRNDRFDPRYVPYGVQHHCFNPHMRDRSYMFAFQNKAYLQRVYLGIKQPVVICRKVEGIYYDDQFEQIDEAQAAALCLKRLERTEIVIKPSGLCGGKGVVFLREATEAQIRAEFAQIPKTMVVQEAVRQHPQMAALNPSTVNTVRLTTYLKGSEVVPLAALVKVGSPNMRVDNYKHGGHLLGVYMDGTTNKYALSVDLKKVKVLPTGVDLSEGMQIPGFDNVLKTAKRAHLMTPQTKIISWDIAIDESAEAVIIEANHGGDLRMHHAVTGPLFGEMTQEVLDDYLLKRFCRERCTWNYNYNEYCDHVEITKYAGLSKTAVVPAQMNGKPVTVIAKKAFADNGRLQCVKLPESIVRVEEQAFSGCAALTEIACAKAPAETAANACAGSAKVTAQSKKSLGL